MGRPKSQFTRKPKYNLQIPLTEEELYELEPIIGNKHGAAARARSVLLTVARRMRCRPGNGPGMNKSLVVAAKRSGFLREMIDKFGLPQGSNGEPQGSNGEPQGSTEQSKPEEGSD